MVQQISPDVLDWFSQSFHRMKALNVTIIIIIIIIKHIYRAHFRRMPQMHWSQQLHVK